MSNQPHLKAPDLGKAQSAYTPYAFESMSRAELLVANAMLDAPRAGYLALDDLAYKFVPIPPRKQRAKCRCIQLKVGGANVAIELPSLICDAWLAQKFDADVPDGLSPLVAAMMLEQAMMPLVSIIEKSTRMPIEFRQIVSSQRFDHEFNALRNDAKREQSFLALHYAVIAKGSPQPQMLRMICPHSWLQMMVDCTPKLEQKLDSKWLDLQVDIAVVAAVARLDAASLAQLGPGDVILADHSLLAQNKLGLIGPGCHRLATLKNQELLIEEGDYPVMSEVENAHMSATNNVPVDVQFRLGTLQMTVGQLSDMVQGQVLQLGKAITSPVEICVNGSVVGSGQLVEVEGQVAIRVTQTHSR